jgi:hypothetical protein
VTIEREDPEEEAVIAAKLLMGIPRHPASDSTRSRPSIPRDLGHLFE